MGEEQPLTGTLSSELQEQVLDFHHQEAVLEALYVDLLTGIASGSKSC